MFWQLWVVAGKFSTTLWLLCIISNEFGLVAQSDYPLNERLRHSQYLC